MIVDGTNKHDNRQDRSGSENRAHGLPFERRRPGRVEIENQHLIRMLRRPDAGAEGADLAPPVAPPGASMPPARGMLLIAAAAALFWAIMLVALRLG